MGLSPTVFASSYRTYLFLNFSFIIAAIIIYREIINLAKPRALFYINILMVLMALANFSAIPVGYEIVKPFFGRP
jgi:cytochrome c oxidase assembly factor CtaG